MATLSPMGLVRSPRPVNLFCGLISNDPDLLTRAVRMLVEYAGPTDAVSAIWPFDSTDYYELEMGEDLQRQFVRRTDRELGCRFYRNCGVDREFC